MKYLLVLICAIQIVLINKSYSQNQVTLENVRKEKMLEFIMSKYPAFDKEKILINDELISDSTDVLKIYSFRVWGINTKPFIAIIDGSRDNKISFIENYSYENIIDYFQKIFLSNKNFYEQERKIQYMKRVIDVLEGRILADSELE